MILGRYSHVFSACFDEIDAAVTAIDKAAGRDRKVVLNAHHYLAPPGSIVYNFENVPGQVSDPAERWKGHECWDFSESNAAKYGAKHVPVGYHPSMERFKRPKFPDIDVVFTGGMNERRAKIIDDLQARGFHVVVIPPGSLYGTARDNILSRARLALNMLFYPDGTFPALRVAHLVANRVPVVSERCPEQWNFVPHCDYADLVSTIAGALNADPSSPTHPDRSAEHAYGRFRDMPMRLPS
jgi:hypothetical protein